MPRASPAASTNRQPGRWCVRLGTATGRSGFVALGYRLDPRRHVLVERRAREPVAILGHRKLIGRNPILKFLTFAVGVPQAGPVRQRDVTGQHCIGEHDYTLGARTLRYDAYAAAALDSKCGGVYRVHIERARGILWAPLRISDDGVRGRGAPLACGEHERELRVARRMLVDKRLKFGYQLGDRKIDRPIMDSAPGFRIRIDADDDSRAILQNRVEQRVAELGAFAAEGRAAQRLRIPAREIVRDTPDRCGVFVSRAERRA